MDEEPLNLCLKDEQRFTDSGNEDRFSSPGVLGSSNSGCCDDDDDGDDDDEGALRGSTSAGGGGQQETISTMDGSGPEMDSSLSVIEQINSLRKFIHEKRLSKFYEMYLMQLRVHKAIILVLFSCLLRF